jgi:hypothetical protein
MCSCRVIVGILFGAASALMALAAQPDGFWDERFFLPGINGEVRAIAVSGQTLYVGGQFTSADDVTVTNIANWNGTNWSAFGGGVNGPINAIAVHGDDVFVGGAFTTAGGAPASRIAKWNGAAWSPLGGGITGASVNALAVASSGVLYAAGDFTNAGGIAVANIARWGGTNWSALGSGLSNGDFAAWVWTLAISGTNLYAGGFFTEAGGVTANCIARWNGATWSALGSGLDDRDYLPQVTALAVSGSDLYVGGAFTQAGNVSAAHVARWNGSNWSALGDGLERFFGDIPVAALAASGSGLIVGGTFVSASGVNANHLARWDGNSWSELAGGAGGKVNALAASAGHVLVGGSFTFTNALASTGLARWNGVNWAVVSAGGGLGLAGSQTCAGACTGDDVAALAVSGGRVYAAGGFLSAGGVRTANVARWDGTNWNPLGGGIVGQVFALAVNGGDLFAGGRFTSAGGVDATNVARWNGSTWSPLGRGINGPVHALLADGGQLYAGGEFTSAGNVSASNLARWDGADWFPLGSGVNGPVYALAAGSNALYAGGKFTSAGSVNATNVAQWNGSMWGALRGGVSGVANPFARLRPPPVLALLVNGRDLFVGGDFALAGGVAATNLARWDGTNWFALGDGVPGTIGLTPPPAVDALALHRGELIVGGTFNRAGGAPASSIARWNGTEWSAFGDGVSGGVEALAARGNNIFVGGHFKFAGGKPASDFCVWHLPPSLRIMRDSNGVIVSWPQDAEGYVLQASESLAPAAWQNVTSPATLAAEEMTVGESISLPGRFYRLRR